MDYTRNSDCTLVGRHGKRGLGRIWSRSADIINMSFKVIGCEDVDCIQVAYDIVKWRILLSRLRKNRAFFISVVVIMFSRSRLHCGVIHLVSKFSYTL
jgi:hypothetical protein